MSCSVDMNTRAYRSLKFLCFSPALVNQPSHTMDVSCGREGDVDFVVDARLRNRFIRDLIVVVGKGCTLWNCLEEGVN